MQTICLSHLPTSETSRYTAQLNLSTRLIQPELDKNTPPPKRTWQANRDGWQGKRTLFFSPPHFANGLTSRKKTCWLTISVSGAHGSGTSPWPAATSESKSTDFFRSVVCVRCTLC